KKKKVVAKKKKPVAKKKAIKRPVKKLVKKKAAKRPVKKVAKKAVKKAVKFEGTVVGKVTHYFPHVMAAVVKLKAPLNVGDRIKIKGHTTDLAQAVTSMQMDRSPISVGKKGQEIGLQVSSRVRQHDIVLKV
ncbi:MAG: hypothetical protein PHT31_04220, partial [Candidatus Omnitrophica bacterium]|nr:hypothetical protein [Candidatus Omnitrophota bacterium]